MSSVPMVFGETAIGPPVLLGCSHCIYEASSHDHPSARLLNVPRATHDVQTPNGPRQVCEGHARALTLPASP